MNYAGYVEYAKIVFIALFTTAVVRTREQLRVLATDAGSVRDFQVFAEQSGHALLASEEVDGVYRYLLQKA